MRRLLILPVLVILMVTAGCTCDTNEPPTAYIDLITPTEVSTGETVTFEGHGTDADGTVVAYRWESSIDGDLSTRASFESSSFSEGEHTIGLKVQDNNGTWSEEVESTLVVSGAAAGPPVIDSFAASPGSISPGEPSTLSWGVSGAETVSIDQGIGSVALSGNRPVAPVATTTYTLTATNAAGSVTATARVLLSGAGAGGAAGVPVISYFTADPETVPPGGPSTLSWSVSNADTVTISSGTESLLVGPVGTATASPATTTTYTLTATNAAGGVTRTARVSVGAGGAAGSPTIDYFTATPDSITAGESSELSWSVSNADTAWLGFVAGSTGGTQMVAPADSKTVNPSETTTYTLTAGDASAEVVVTVEAAPAEEHTVTLYPEAFPRSGQVQSTGDVFGNPTAGDLGSNVAVKAYSSFDITGLATAEVTNAVLTFSTQLVIGDPWSHLMWLYIDAVDYGPQLDAADFGLMGEPLSEVHSEPPAVVNIPVTAAVQYYVTHGAPRFQVMAWFASDTNHDGLADYWRSGATLTVTYLE